jgi:hypothetical protein
MSTRKVYWKTLEILARVLKSYIERNQLGLFNNLTTEQYNCVQALLTAIIECLQVLPEHTH